MKYGFVYIWFDRKHKRYYIGSHWGTEDDGYICSSSWMKQAYKRRPNDFKRRILSLIYTCRKDLLEEEYYWLSMIKKEELKGIRYYNIVNYKNGHWTSENYEEDVRKRISIATKEAMQRPEVRKNLLEGHKDKDNRSSEPEVRKKRSDSMKKTMAIKFPVEERNSFNRSKQGSKEHSQKLSEASKLMWNKRTEKQKSEIGKKISISNKGLKNRLGHKNTLEQNKKISESNKGKKRTPETCKKISIAVTGIKRSEESKYKRSQKMKEMWKLRKQGLLPMPKYSKKEE